MHEGLLKTENLKTTYSNTGKISKKTNEQFTEKLIQPDFKHGKQWLVSLTLREIQILAH